MALERVFFAVSTVIGGDERLLRAARGDESAPGRCPAARMEEIDAFAREFGPQGEKLAPYKGSRLLVLPRMDHDLTKAIGRRDAEQAVTEFLKAA